MGCVKYGGTLAAFFGNAVQRGAQTFDNRLDKTWVIEKGAKLVDFRRLWPDCTTSILDVFPILAAT
jgi:hypothetical protein